MSLKSNLGQRLVLSNDISYFLNNNNRFPALVPNSNGIKYTSWLAMQVSFGTRPPSWAESKVKVLAKRRAKNKARKATNSKKRK
jgi:hypothetical protein